MLGAAVRPVLEQHVEAGQGRFRGVRTRAAWHEHPAVHPLGLTQPGMVLDPRLQEGARELGAMGLTLDVWVYHTQLREVAALADACPRTTLVLDHCGCPLGVGPYAGARADVFEAWAADLSAVALRPNVVLKIGGLAMPRMGHRFHEQPAAPDSKQLVAAWRPYFETCISAFGARRCMFESNFPVDKGAVGYRVLWNAYKRFSMHCTPTEKLDLFARTAARTYRLEHRLEDHFEDRAHAT
jgi:predicted TIM-barrel fold metal-dependent hydrolase